MAYHWPRPNQVVCVCVCWQKLVSDLKKMLASIFSISSSPWQMHVNHVMSRRRSRAHATRLRDQNFAPRTVRSWTLK